MNRPQPDEYPEYYNLYVNLVRDGDIVDILNSSRKIFNNLYHLLKKNQVTILMHSANGQ